MSFPKIPLVGGNLRQFSMGSIPLEFGHSRSSSDTQSPEGLTAVPWERGTPGQRTGNTKGPPTVKPCTVAEVMNDGGRKGTWK